MKKISLALLAGTMVFASCKKGENDPAISLISRKARVAGDWTIDKYIRTSTQVDGSDTYSDVTTFDGASYSSVSTHTSGGTSVSTTVTGTIATNTISFDKEGTFKKDLVYTTVETQDNFGATIVTTTTYTKMKEGSWNFLGKVDEFANKERIVLNTTSESTTTKVVAVTTIPGFPSTTSTTQSTNSDTYADGEDAEVWALDRLASDEMIVKQDLKDTFSTSTIGSITTTTSYTTTGSVAINLSQK